MRAALAISLGLAACVQPGTATDEAPIIGGAPSATDDAVVLLISFGEGDTGFLTCTGSLIAPTIVLTAAHCIDAANHPDHEFAVFPGADANAYGSVSEILPDTLPVAAVHPHPDYDPQPPFSADIGVVELVAPITTVDPLPIARTAPTAAMVGMPARIVGYGQTTYGDYNAARYAADTAIAGLDPDDTVRVGDATHRTCLGDSGSPALVELAGVETVIGVDSYTDTAGCTEPAHFRRTDAYLDFLDPFLAAEPPDAGVGGPDADVEDPGVDEEGGGCCGVGGGAGGSTALALLLAVTLVRRRR